MDFLKPKPIRRQKSQKSKQISLKSDYKKNIFEEIRSLCRRPTPIVSPIDDLKAILNDIKSLCRIPVLLTPIEDLSHIQLESQSQQTLSKTNRRKKKLFYRDSDQSQESVKSESIENSKLFFAVVKGKQIIDNKVIKSCNQINNKKRSTLKSCAKTKSLAIRPKPLFNINCNIKTKINEYSKEYSKPKLKKRSIKEKSDSNSSITSERHNGFSDSSISSPSLSYSLPATPISSSDSSVNSSSSTFDSNSSQSLLNRVRKALHLNINFESYRQYFEEEINSKAKKRKKCSKQTIDFKQKVLEWKANRISSGNTTPIHNIEFLETPPGSPFQQNNNLIDDELNSMINSLENQNFNLTDNMINEFDMFLSDLYSDIPNT